MKRLLGLGLVLAGLAGLAGCCMGESLPPAPPPPANDASPADSAPAASGWETERVTHGEVSYEVPAGWEEDRMDYALGTYRYRPAGSTIDDEPSNVNIIIAEGADIPEMTETVKQEFFDHQQALIQKKIPEATGFSHAELYSGDLLVLILRYQAPYRDQTAKMAEICPMIDDYALTITTADLGDGVTPPIEEVGRRLAASVQILDGDDDGWTDGVYENKAFGLRFVLPEGWMAATDDQIEQVAGEKRAEKYLMFLANADMSINFQVMREDYASAEAYLDETRAEMADDHLSVGETGSMTVGGQEYLWMPAEMPDRAVWTLVRQTDAGTLVFGVTFPVAQEDEVRAVLQNNFG